MRPEYYADVYRQYQTFIRQHQLGQRTRKIASGSHDANYHWTEVLMREAGTMMDGLSLHYYTVPGTWAHKGSATDFDAAEWFITLQKALVMEELVREHAAVMDRFDPERRVGMVVDEWGTWYDVEPGTNPGFLYQQNTLRDALVAAVSLNIFNNHCDRVTMANLAQTVNVLQALLLTEGPNLVKTPTYYVFALYAVHQGNTQVAVQCETESYSVGDGSIGKIHASASRDASGAIHLSLANLHHEASAAVAVVLETGDRPTRVGSTSGQILSGPEIGSRNSFDAPATVRPGPFTAIEIRDHQLQISVPPKSVVQLKIETN